MKASDLTEKGYYWWCPEFLVRDGKEKMESSWSLCRD